MNIGDQIGENVYYAGDMIPTEAEGIKCVSCGKGYAEQVPGTEEECRQFGCRLDDPDYVCCLGAFKCVVCDARNVGKRQIPDSVWC